MLTRCIAIPLICLSLVKSLTKPSEAIVSPKAAPSGKLISRRMKLINERVARKSFHSKRYLPSMRKNLLIFSTISETSLSFVSILYHTYLYLSTVSFRRNASNLLTKRKGGLQFHPKENFSFFLFARCPLFVRSKVLSEKGK